MIRELMLEKKLFGVRVIWLIVCLELVAIALSLGIFSGQSLRLDEAQSLWQTSHSYGRMLQIIGEDVHVPLYHSILHFWQFFFGNGVDTARLLSLFFFLLVIPMMYLFGAYLYGPATGLFGALLVSISPFMNWYASEIRMYSLFVFLAILNQYLFVRLYHEKEEEAPWIAYAFSAVFGLYTHYFFAFVLLGQVVFYFTHRTLFAPNAFMKFGASAALAALAFAPWLWWVHALGDASSMRPLLATPTTSNLFNTFSQFLFGFQDDHLNSIILSLWPILVLFAFLALRRKTLFSPDTEYMLIAAFVPIGGAFVASFLLQPIYVTRYLIIAIPALYLLIAAVIRSYPRRLAYAFQTSLVAIMIVMLGVEAWSAQTPVKENYREVAAYLEQYALPQDVVVVSAPFTVYPIEYYYRGGSAITTLPLWDRSRSGAIPPFDAAKLPDQVAALRPGHEVLWLVLSYDQGYEDELRTYFDSHYERAVVEEFSPGLAVYAYKLRYDTKRVFPVATSSKS